MKTEKNNCVPTGIIKAEEVDKNDGLYVLELMYESQDRTDGYSQLTLASDDPDWLISIAEDSHLLERLFADLESEGWYRCIQWNCTSRYYLDDTSNQS